VASSASTERLDGILQRVGDTVLDFFERFVETGATEILRQGKMDKKGRVVDHLESNYYYILAKEPMGKRIGIQEYRRGKRDRSM